VQAPLALAPLLAALAPPAAVSPPLLEGPSIPPSTLSVDDPPLVLSPPAPPEANELALLPQP
jgi:hypothetical protein